MHLGDQKFTLKQQLRIESFLYDIENSNQFFLINHFQVFRDKSFNFFCSYFQGGDNSEIHHYKIDEDGTLINLKEQYFKTPKTYKHLVDSFDKLIEIKRDDLSLYFESNSTIPEKRDDIENFWIRVYLGSGRNWMDLTLSRAYRDLNRTIHGMGEVNFEVKELNFPKLKTELGELISKILITPTFMDQLSFDKAHFDCCCSLKSIFSNYFHGIQFTHGQAQKWINMTIKYLYALGDSRYKGISKNLPFYHIPVDEIIQIKLFDKFNIAHLKDGKIDKWSRIDNYESYLKYQEKVRGLCLQEFPLQLEMKLFNEE